MTQETTVCKNCNLTYTPILRKDSALESEHRKNLNEMKNIILKHNKEKGLFGKEWQLKYTMNGAVYIADKKDLENIHLDEGFVVIMEGYNYYECPACKHRNYFKIRKQ